MEVDYSIPAIRIFSFIDKRSAVSRSLQIKIGCLCQTLSMSAKKKKVNN